MLNKYRTILYDWKYIVIVVASTIVGIIDSECMVPENSAAFIPVCDIKKVFPEIENAKLDNFKNYFRVNGDNLELLQSLDRENLIANQRCDSNKISNYATSGQCVLMLELIGSGPRFFQMPVVVADVNDNVPSFDWLYYSVRIAENSPANVEVELPQARDTDRGRNGTVAYSLQKSPESYKFILLNPSSNGAQESPLKLKILQPFDKEIDENLQLVMIAKDLGIPPLSSSLILKIEILDVNDHVPEFNQSSYRFSIPESLPQGHSIGRVFARDRDVSSRITVMFSPSASSHLMERFIVASDGVISTKMAMEYSPSNYEYRIPVIAVDSGSPVLTATTTVFVHITDVNDNSPVIEVTSNNLNNRLSITENCPTNTYVAKVTAKDKDYGVNGQVECRLDHSNMFSLEPIPNFDYRRYYKLVTAPLSLFDREVSDSHLIVIICFDKGVPSLTTKRSINIIINDENDNSPIFPQTHVSVKLSENQPMGTKVVTLRAEDKDYGINAQIRYKLSEESQTNFMIDSNTGTITTLRIFDREVTSMVTVEASAYDSLLPHLQSNVTVHVTILDENDKYPIFDQNLTFHVKENSEGHAGRIRATDDDEGMNREIEFFLVNPSHTFRVTKSGDIIVQRKYNLDREKIDHYSLEVGARDKGLRSLTSSATVTIIVDDINDNTPIFTRPKPGHLQNISASTQPGSRIFTAEAIDQDSGLNGRIIYSMRAQNFFIINSSDGGIFLNSTLTNEIELPPKLIIFAQDCGTPSLTATASIVLTYVVNGRNVVTIENKNAERKMSSPKDLVLSLGIGVVLLIFICLVVLVTYFCVSIIIQKQRQKRDINKDRCALDTQSSALCHCFSVTQGNDGRLQRGSIDQGRGILTDPMIERQQQYPVCLNEWEQPRGPVIDEESLYGYREFTKRPSLDCQNDSPGGIYDHISTLPRPTNQYWQYSTIGHNIHRPFLAPVNRQLHEAIYHQGLTFNNTSHQSHPDIVKSTSSDEVDRTLVYGQMSPSVAHSNWKLAIIPHGNYDNDKPMYASDNRLSSREMLAQLSHVDNEPVARFAGYVVGRPCYANSFV